ncbi:MULTISPECIES: ferredoxin [Actinomadura]|uniref:Ferredoxin n=1 Tax=Actinomadura yumaensis TaxID=111807 RepID=A0ABW2CSF3_9ACTN|nr:ferredoxin [Actinomadura sp. J1-007]
MSATKETCAVASLCVYNVPEVFDQDEDGQVEVLDAEPPADLHQAVRTAARACPTRSIHIETP